ncbi:hypothetical protein [Streptomyces morookaense]|uniref:Uncharacterized protein n=1 Tax=Streptomyces morookaense TaxID=1970 RepID=A0A7Y7B8B5_STRMO|nr:hypothetical protein [Streptomyces morookaense]NVK80887.1 hypothetical protein [Streptomyces morookaense]GHF28815.1 hypothetical protein GCM10010359_34110 [Streptomyces morookaense]
MSEQVPQEILDGVVQSVRDFTEAEVALAEAERRLVLTRQGVLDQVARPPGLLTAWGMSGQGACRAALLGETTRISTGQRGWSEALPRRHSETADRDSGRTKRLSDPTAEHGSDR